MANCDGCNRDKRDVVSCGRDANGDPDAPDLCFLCRQEGNRGRVFDEQNGQYVKLGVVLAAVEEARKTEPCGPPDMDEDTTPF